MKILKQYNSIKIAGTLPYLLTALLFLALLTTSCSKDDDTPPATLSSISPQSGPKTSIVTINGNNFGTNPEKVTVYFNEVEAVVQSVNDTKITAIVPARAFTGLVKVVINGAELIGPEFEYIITDIQVSTIAGSTYGFADGAGANAQFGTPYDVVVDSQDNIYVADLSNHRIRKITPNGVVSTIAGSTTYGFADGAGANAQFDRPIGVAVDSQDNIYVADLFNRRIRKITPNGVVSTIAGSTYGFADGAGANAQFGAPDGVAVDSQDNIYVADMSNHRIRKITPNGVVSTIAGSTRGFADGSGANAKFYFPKGVAVDTQDNIYVTDEGNNRIRKITPNGTVSTIAGSTYGFADGSGANAQFSNLNGIVVDSQGNIYVADVSNHRIRKITPNGVVSTIAGSTRGYADGSGANAKFLYPSGVAVDSQNNIYVADANNNRIRKITME